MDSEYFHFELFESLDVWETDSIFVFLVQFTYFSHGLLSFWYRFEIGLFLLLYFVYIDGSSLVEFFELVVYGVKLGGFLYLW